jgi:hypothetical protein
MFAPFYLLSVARERIEVRVRFLLLNFYFLLLL